MATVGKITIDMVARTAKLEKGLTRARTQIKRLQSRAQTMNRVLRRAGGLFLTYFGARTIIRGITNTVAAIDNLAKTSAKLGIATEHLAGLRLAGRLTGIQVRTLDMALQRMTRRVAEAAKGTGEAKAAIKELGLDAVKLAAAGTHKAFLAIAEAMKQVKDPAHRLRLAFKLFDSEGAALVNTLALGVEGLRKVQEQAEKTGLAVGFIGAKGVEKMRDAFTELGAAMQGFGRQTVVTVAPALEATAKGAAKTLGVMQQMLMVGRFMREARQLGAAGPRAPAQPLSAAQRFAAGPRRGGGAGFLGRQMGVAGVGRGILGMMGRLRGGAEGLLGRAQAGIAGLGKRAPFGPTQFMQADIGRMALQDRVVGTARRAQEVESSQLASLLTGILRALEKGTPAVAGPF